jgi:hypothetical protein
MVEIGYIGAIYVRKLRESIRTLPQCFDRQLDTFCTPIGWGIYAVQWILLVTVLVVNIYQCRTHRLSKRPPTPASTTTATTTSTMLRLTNTLKKKTLKYGPWVIRSICLVIIILQTISFISDYNASKSLLNLEESQWGLGQILTLGLAIVSNGLAIVHVVRLGGKSQKTIQVLKKCKIDRFLANLSSSSGYRLVHQKDRFRRYLKRDVSRP